MMDENKKMQDLNGRNSATSRGESWRRGPMQEPDSSPRGSYFKLPANCPGSDAGFKWVRLRLSWHSNLPFLYSTSYGHTFAYLRDHPRTVSCGRHRRHSRLRWSLSVEVEIAVLRIRAYHLARCDLDGTLFRVLLFWSRYASFSCVPLW